MRGACALTRGHVRAAPSLARSLPWRSHATPRRWWYGRAEGGTGRRVSPGGAQVFNFVQYLAELRASDPKYKDVEGLEVATQCLVDAFGVGACAHAGARPPDRRADLENAEQQKAMSIKPMSLAAVVEGARILMAQGAEKRAAASAAEDPRWPAFQAQLKKSKYFTAEEGTPGAHSGRTVCV